MNLRIKVLYETNLNLDSYRDGYIKVKNVSGVIHTHSEHGEIQLLDIAGSATAFSRNGNLTIGFREVAGNAKLDFESYNGSIDLTLPKSIAASTAVSTGRGSYATEFEIKSVSDQDRFLWLWRRSLSFLAVENQWFVRPELMDAMPA